MNLVTPDYGLIFWMVLSFLLLLFIMKKFAWKPILSALKERENTIKDALNEANKARDDMKSLKFSNEELLREAKDDRDSILREARKIKEVIIEEAKKTANEEANNIVKAAKDSIHYEKMAAITELKNQIAVLSIDISSKILKEHLNENDKQKELIKKLMGEMKFN